MQGEDIARVRLPGEGRRGPDGGDVSTLPGDGDGFLEVEAITLIARAAHAGQVDKAGRDYFQAHLTPIAAGAAPFGPAVVQAAWLHDIVEDTAYTVEQLRAEKVRPEVVAAVDAVTRRDETYRELISRACADPIGRYVKLADNAWNITCNPDLAARAAAETLLTDRYLPARRRLLSACGLSEDSPLVLRMQSILDEQRQALQTGGGSPVL